MSSARDLWRAPWVPGDERAFTPRADMGEELAATGWDWSQGPPGPTWTLLRSGGQVLGMGGLIDHGGHVEAWACLGPMRRRDWPVAIWHARQLLAFASKPVMAACRADFPGAARCLARLGFEALRIGQDPRLAGVRLRYMIRSA